MRKLPTVLTQEEVGRLFAAAENPLDRLMLRTCYYLGVRVSELLALQWSDIDFKARTVRIGWEAAKGGKERLVPLPKAFATVLKGWKAILDTDGCIFKGTRSTVWRKIKKIAKAAGITKAVHPHTLRHSYATHVLRVTKRLDVVQDLLGHASIGTTRIYTHLDVDDLQEEISKVW